MVAYAAMCIFGNLYLDPPRRDADGMAIVRLRDAMSDISSPVIRLGINHGFNSG